MPEFSKSSKDKLKTCDSELQILFNYVIKYFDCTIVCGERGKEAQNKAFEDGFSTVQYPHSKHNSSPSQAVDVVPYPTLYSDEKKIIEFGGFVMGIATMLKVYNAMDKKIIWGGNWKWKDYPHYQIS